MGAASWRRGTEKIMRDIRAQERPLEFDLIDRWNAVPKLPSAVTPLTDVEIEYDKQRDCWWVMTAGNPNKWAPCYKSMYHLMECENICITGLDISAMVYKATPIANKN